MKILAVIVSYYPDKKLFGKNLSAKIDNVDKILIWENTPKKVSEQYRFCQGEKITFASTGYNVGISYALNYAWHYAEKHGYDYLLTMDQDSVWHDFDKFKETTILNPLSPHGIMSPPGIKINDKLLFRKVNFAITSGMLLSVEIIKELGGWYSKFKVDGIDNDFCCCALSKGIDIWQVSSGWLEQRCGEPIKHHLGRHEFICHNYSPRRLYGIYRNHIITFRKYKKVKAVRQLSQEWKREWFKFRIFPVSFERQRFRKLLAIALGVIVGISYPSKMLSSSR